MSQYKPGLSVVMITKNEGQRITSCLQSVAFADEIVVLDGASEDDTVAKAKALGATVVVDPAWPGFGPQKNRVLAMATHEWVLSLDADEALTPELSAAVQQVVAGRSPLAGLDDGPIPVASGYWINRRSCFAGRPLRFGDWSSDKVLRLVRNGQARFSDLPVHEQLQCEPPTARLNGLLMHYTLDSMADARDKAHRYAAAAAPRVAGLGKGGLISAWLHGGWAFVRGAVLRGGLLDGRYGLMLAYCNAYGTWLRYRMAGELRRTGKA